MSEYDNDVASLVNKIKKKAINPTIIQPNNPTIIQTHKSKIVQKMISLTQEDVDTIRRFENFAKDNGIKGINASSIIRYALTLINKEQLIKEHPKKNVLMIRGAK